MGYLIPTFVVLSVGWFVLSLYPKPLPGIPYNGDATKRMLGDTTVVKAKAKKTKEQSEAIFDIARQLRAPIAQLLATAFTGPFIIVDEPREVEDILVRRHREFDRSRLTTQFFKPLFPHCSIAQLNTPTLKAQKRLWSDSMSPDFLRRVVAPNIYKSAMELVEFWHTRADQAKGEPFPVRRSFETVNLDVIWVAIVGTELGSMRRQIELARKGELEADESREAAPSFEDASSMEPGAVMQYIMDYTNYIVEKGYQAVWPAFTFWWIRQTPTYRRCMRIRDAELHRLINAACGRFRKVVEGGDDGERLDTCAMDLVLRREMLAARKAGKLMPDLTKDLYLMDELLLLLLAGHDSTSNTLSWFVKLISANPEAQITLRETLLAKFSGSQTPSAAEILDTDIPYLDAVVEETLRVAGTAGVVARCTTVDTVILGHKIPAGTDLVLNTRYLKKPITVPEKRRSPTCQAAMEKRIFAGFEPDDGRTLHLFEPRRWLVANEQGREMFDPHALPSLVFGGGFRGCFGKKLAMQELRIMIALMVLNFELLPLPKELTSMEGEEYLFRRPKFCHVRLRAL